jgi:hypothetical protein
LQKFKAEKCEKGAGFCRGGEGGIGKINTEHKNKAEILWRCESGSKGKVKSDQKKGSISIDL